MAEILANLAETAKIIKERKKAKMPSHSDCICIMLMLMMCVVANESGG